VTNTVQNAGTTTTDAGGTQTTDTSTQDAAGTVDTSKTDETTSESKTEAPADVDYKFDVPEGVALDETRLGEFKTIAKELKLPQDAAQKVLALAVQHEQARADAFATQVQQWADAVKADKELGSEESLAAAVKAVETFGTPELKDLLNSTGMGNHPEVVKLMAKIGKAISEDKLIAGRTGGNAPPRDLASVLYGQTPN
jgi:hypothetical protein